jgi:hypothetical protein
MSIFQIIIDEDYTIIVVLVLASLVLIEKRMYFYIILIDLDDHLVIFLPIDPRKILQFLKVYFLFIAIKIMSAG